MTRSHVELPPTWCDDGDTWSFVAADTRYPGQLIHTSFSADGNGRKLLAACTSQDAMVAADRLLSGEAARR